MKINVCANLTDRNDEIYKKMSPIINVNQLICKKINENESTSCKILHSDRIIEESIKKNQKAFMKSPT